MTKDLALSNQLLSPENNVKMLTLLFPCSIKSHKEHDEFSYTRLLFTRIFKENSSSLRNTFFCDPLIKHLWGTIYVKECAEVFTNHLKKIRGQPNEGEIKFMRIFK